MVVVFEPVLWPLSYSPRVFNWFIIRAHMLPNILRHFSRLVAPHFLVFLLYLSIATRLCKAAKHTAPTAGGSATSHPGDDFGRACSEALRRARGRGLSPVGRFFNPERAKHRRLGTRDARIRAAARLPVKAGGRAAEVLIEVELALFLNRKTTADMRR